MPDQITPAEIAELRSLHEAATKEPWEADEWYETDGEGWAAVGPVHAEHSEDFDFPHPVEGIDHRLAKKDAALIAATRNALPRLLDTIESQRAEIERLRARRDGDSGDR